MAFSRDLRELREINEDDYMVSIRSHETLRQLIASKKNDTHIQLSHHKKFIIKIISKNDMKVLLHILPNYYRHLQTHRNTLLPNFLGLHIVKPLGSQKIRFVIVQHILRSDLSIHKEFNFKTLHHSRHISIAGLEEDLSVSFYLHTLARSQLLGQIKIDCQFLEEEGSNDINKQPSDAESSNESNSDQDLICDSDSQSSSQIVSVVSPHRHRHQLQPRSIASAAPLPWPRRLLTRSGLAHGLGKRRWGAVVRRLRAAVTRGFPGRTGTEECGVAGEVFVQGRGF